MKIFIVEDDADIRRMESYALTNSGYEVQEFADGAPFMEELGKNLPDLILLDIMLPGTDGLQILRTLREAKRTENIPIMLITAKGSEIDRVRGLDMGADDYISKPFGILEFVSRVKALLRRTAAKEEPEMITYGGIAMDDTKRTVSVDGSPRDLTYKEYELLKYMMMNRGIVLSRETLLSKVWGFEFDGETRTVDMHIKTLRQKLGSRGTCIKTVRNVGYKLDF
ncbi:MAG: response regulator transcription factor [Clostridia bacterium]|nr:response regulator transcription factor [Clostridia bacterium]